MSPTASQTEIQVCVELRELKANREDVPERVNPQDKFQKRLYVPNTTTLRIDKLTLEDSAFSTAVRSSGAHGSGVEDSRNQVSLKGTQGASVVFHVTRRPEVPPEAKLETISWAVKNESNYIVLLHVFPGVDVPEWVNPQDKFKERLRVLNTTTLRIDKLTLEDSGWYRARCSFSTGIENAQYFHLSVYEPVPRPQVLAKILSLTRDWCNVTLECHTPGATGAVNVSWESKGLPRELEQRGAPGQATNPWTLALNLPLSQPSPRVTCVVSSPVDQKTATRDLGEVCVHAPSPAFCCSGNVTAGGWCRVAGEAQGP
ncbi:SLAM family member 9-like [Hyaena hyaena]|uniref:SLAM family member 9-like n=1 Tax=Hyaena hyaena TaxID=95912 RepID=UPI001922C83F|nr:SLAM family member 9-like [Hyaena hyaena]